MPGHALCGVTSTGSAMLPMITFIDDAALAHVLACDALHAEAACAGGVYFISQGEPVNLWSWINGLLADLGIPSVRRRISFTTARRIGTAFEVAYRMLGINSEPRMTRFLASQLSQSHYFDISAARRDLDYEPRVSTVDGVKRLVEDFHA